MDLKELGALLRKEREQQGLSLDQVIEKIKIGRRSLMAIEEGNAKAMPHPVYARGFVRSYAMLLGLDAEALGEALSQHHFVRDPEVVVDRNKSSNRLEGLTKATKQRSPLAVAALLGLLLAMLIGGVLSLDFDHPTPPAKTVDAPVASVPAPTLPQAVIAQPQSTPLDVGAQGTMASGAASLEDLAARSRLGNTSEAFASIPASSATPPVPAGEKTAITAPPILPGPSSTDLGHTLAIRAKQNCWLLAEVDGQDRGHFTLFRGQRHTITFKNRLDLRLGNAGGVELTLNGESYPLTGHSGEVVNLTLP